MAKAAKKTTTTTEPAQAARVFGYVRVSTTQQADEGESLQVQRRQITGYAQMQGLKIEKVFVERGISGSKPLDDRPQGSALIGTLRPGDTVITAKLDRMFRSASNALEIMGAMKKAGISLHMLDLGGDVTGNGVSKLVFTILAAVAEAERDRIRERITEAKRDQRAQGGTSVASRPSAGRSALMASWSGFPRSRRRSRGSFGCGRRERATGRLPRS